MKTFKDSLLIPLGGTAYGLIEVLWRGHTHWTMLLLGGLCFYIMAQIGSISALPLYLRAVPCAYCITILEFLTGCIVNLLLDWNVWDYSRAPGNLLGQICPLYFLLWYFLCYPVYGLTGLLRKGFLRTR